MLAGARQYVDAVKSVQKEEKFRDDRKCNLKITGLSKINSETTELSNLNNFLTELSPNRKLSITHAKRITRLNKPDFVIATFSNFEDRNEILNRSHILRKSTQFSNIYLSPDWTPEQDTEQYHLREEKKRQNNLALIDDPNFADWFVVRNGKLTQLSKIKRNTN